MTDDAPSPARVPPAPTGTRNHPHQEDAARVTAETSSNDVAHTDTDESGAATARLHLLVASILFVVGILAATFASLQLVLPNVSAGIAEVSYGRLAPVSRILITYGWAIPALLGLSYYALAHVTGNGVKRRTLTTVSVALIGLGAVGGAVGILIGLSSGTSGQESPIWARALIAVGALLAAAAISSTARVGGDRLGTTGWYLTSAPVLLAASMIVGLVPAPAGIPGVIVSSFVGSGVTLFIVTASVGLLYFVFGKISGSDLTEPRHLAALGFWSLILVWSFMNGTELIYSAVPDWLETITVAMAIGSFVPAIAIATDIGMILRGRVAGIGDRASLRYATVAALSLITATGVNFLLTWRASSAIVQFSIWVQGLTMLIILGGASFAIFAGHRVLNGGRAKGWSFHFASSTLALIIAAGGLLVGGVLNGFSWAGGPASQKFPNYGGGWEVTTSTLEPVLWAVHLALMLYAAGQIVFLVGLRSRNDEVLPVPDHGDSYDLQFEGEPRYITWKRLTRGVAAVWVSALVFSVGLPILDTTDRDPTLLADTSRTYENGSAAEIGRSLYIAQGCAECHSQEVRPVGTDVGLGAVSIAGDYAYENPVLLGTIRFGPDLTHVAGREGFEAEAIKSHLQDPRAARPWSNMPSYSYLSRADLDALVIYIQTLR